MTVTLEHFLLLSAALFAVGVFGILTRRNAIGILIGVELILNAANINFMAFWRYLAPPGSMEGQVFIVIVITAAAAEAAVGLALVLALYRQFGTIDVDEIHNLKG